uniref:Fatty-acid amide hydrolase 2 n=1 Tax=Lygus hesperus TaxID=30085 RepID=A0A0A9ZDX3_LYGHE
MEIKLRLLAAVLLLVSWLMKPYYFIVDLLPKKYCPRIKDEILKMSMTEVASKIRKGELKSSRVVKAYIARIREVNPLLNAVTDERFEEAVKEAEAVDRLIESKSKPVELLEKETPLLGVPITVKESCQVKGMSFAVGSTPRIGMKGGKDGAAVKEARDSGAIILCVTNTPELCLSWEAHNLVTGITRNAYNYYRTSGGSSGGEGALAGAAGSLCGISSDIGGSIRVPALFNGVFGHKPTPGYIPMEGHYPREPSFDNFLSIGPLVRYAEDLPLMMKALSTESSVQKLRLEVPVDVKKLNVFYQETAGYSLVATPVDEDIVDSIRRACSHLQLKGCKVSKTDIPLLSDSVEIGASVLLEIEGVPDLLASSKTKSKDQQSLFGEIVKSHFNMSEFSYAGLMFMLLYESKFFMNAKERLKYRALAEKLKSQFLEMLGENGVFLYPTYPCPAVHHNETFSKLSGVMYPLIFNALSMPSTHVTMGLGRDNLPVGFQVVAAPHQDRLCFAVARELEIQFGGWVPPPSCD